MGWSAPPPHRSSRDRSQCEPGTSGPALLQLTLAGLRSGASLTEALRLATGSGRATGLAPFAGAVRAFDLGAPLDVALRDARAEARDRRVILGLEALSLCVAEQLPSSRGATLIASVVDRLVFEQRTADDVRARTSGLRIQVVLLAVEYGTLFNTGLLFTPTEPLNTIVAIQFVPLLATFGAIAAVTYRRTSSYIPGALICALLLSWYVTAGTATHWYPGFKLPPQPGAARSR